MCAKDDMLWSGVSSVSTPVSDMPPWVVSVAISPYDNLYRPDSIFVRLLLSVPLLVWMGASLFPSNPNWPFESGYSGKQGLDDRCKFATAWAA
jgi:hypothetical protein